MLIARQKEVRTSLRGVAYHLAAHVIPEPPAFTPIRMYFRAPAVSKIDRNIDWMCCTPAAGVLVSLTLAR